MKIETGHRRIPWSWTVWMSFPWLTQQYTEMCSGAPMVFTIRKFADDPMLIGFLSSLNVAFNFLVGAITSYLSDRIRTRWGRRRPFLITGWIGLSVAMFLLPLATNLTGLVVIIIFYQFCQDFAKPYEPLFNEVIPPPQRGRAATIRNVVLSLNGMLFNGILLSQFDRDYGLDALGHAVRISGEQLVYWTGAAMVMIAAGFLAFGVREKIPEDQPRERINLAAFLPEVFGKRQWWMVYLLYCCPILVGGATGWGWLSTFTPLFQTEQLGFSKQHIGWVNATVMFVNLAFFVPLVGFLADRLPRMRLFQIGLIAPAVIHLGLYLVVRYFTDYSLSLEALFAVSILSGGMAAFFFVVSGPLIYDYVPRDRFGTVSAGFSFVSGAVGFIITNAAAWWVKNVAERWETATGSGYDYSSAFLFQFVCALGALGITWYFELQVKRGRVLPHAKLELERDALAKPPADMP